MYWPLFPIISIEKIKFHKFSEILITTKKISSSVSTAKKSHQENAKIK